MNSGEEPRSDWANARRLQSPERAHALAPCGIQAAPVVILCRPAGSCGRGQQPALRIARALKFRFVGLALRFRFHRIGVFPMAIGIKPSPSRRSQWLHSTGPGCAQGGSGKQRHRDQSRCSTHAFTESIAPPSFAGSVPPACAISGRPPPLPPICNATWFTSSPALTLPVRSAVTPAISATLPSPAAGQNDDRALQFVLQLVQGLAQGFRVRAFQRRHQQLRAFHVDGLRGEILSLAHGELGAQLREFLFQRLFFIEQILHRLFHHPGAGLRRVPAAPLHGTRAAGRSS